MRYGFLLAQAASTFALAAACVAPAFAQSTGTLDFDKEIVVTGRGGDGLAKGIGGIATPDTSKATVELNQAWIAHQVPGQSVNDLINYIPGVSFQNNDPFGSAGGTLEIRGFDATRISETFDGVTLNDDGNYALYANELLDSEVIDSVRVNLGTTDVDSPTASASGSTVNFLSHTPTDKPHFQGKLSLGSDSYYRGFVMLDTGVFTPFGTKAFFSASKTGNDSPFNNYGRIKKEEYNGKIYQPLGGNDFLWIAGFYVTLRNNFSGSDPLSNQILQTDNGTGLKMFPTSYANSYYTYSKCTVINSSSNTCGTAYDYRPNPTNIGNLRAALKVQLTDRLVWTMDPSYQFTKANGGGTSTAREAFGPGGMTGYVNGTYFLGQNLLNDGMAGTIPIYVPSQTVTHRVALTTSLRYDITSGQSARLAYAMSDSAIRQTGEASLLNPNGSPPDVFAVDDPLIDGNGYPLEKRDYHSIAALNQVSGEYRGQFFGDRLNVNAGLRVPFLTRNLNNLCFTRNAGGSLSCVFGSSQATYAAAYPSYAVPQTRSFHYSAVLPNVGLTYKITPSQEVFANYSKGMQAPNATALYQSFWFPAGSNSSLVKPEKADNIDLGWRYTTSRLQAQVDLWYTHLVNKLDTAAYNPIDGTTIYANMGPIKRYGIDANLSYKIDNHLSAYVFGSVLKSRIEQNINAGTCGSTVAIYPTNCVDGYAYYQTAGRFEAAIPKNTFGARLQADYGIIAGGIQVKRTGGRYVNAQNTPMYSLNNVVGGVPVPPGTVVWGSEAPAYTLVDLDVRVSLRPLGMPDKSYFQFNVTNLFNQFYVGGFSQVYANTQSISGSPNLLNVQVGSPRAFMGTLAVAF